MDAAPMEEIGGPEAAALVWSQLPFHLTLEILARLPSNEIAGTGRLVCTAAAARLNDPQEHCTFHLSKPVSAHIFATRWGSSTAMRGLTVKKRYELLSLVAGSGGSSCAANLAIALEAVGLAELNDIGVFEAAVKGGWLEACQMLWQHPCSLPPQPRNKAAMAAAAAGRNVHSCIWLHDTYGVPYTDAVLVAAARDGDLALCQSLRQAGCPGGKAAFKAAAAGGHRAVCDWLLESGCVTRLDAAVAAAEAGQPELLTRLLGAEWYDRACEVLAATAAGCDKPALQMVFERAVSGAEGGKHAVLAREGIRALVEAVGSSTVDWRDKADWLLAAMLDEQISTSADGLSDHASDLSRIWQLPPAEALERLTWLRDGAGVLTQEQFGAEADRLVGVAARTGDIEALESCLAAGAVARNMHADIAGWSGHWEVLLLLHSWGVTIDSFHVAGVALQTGRVATLEVLLGALGPAVVLTQRVTRGAAESGSVELVAWMIAHGCTLDAHVFAAAVRGGSEEMLEWLVARGCPMWHRACLRAASNVDLCTLRCLRRLGCPWGQDTFTDACDYPYRAPLSALRWLVEEGCPLNLEEAKRRAVENQHSPVGLLEWLEDLAPVQQPLVAAAVAQPAEQQEEGRQLSAGQGSVGMGTLDSVQRHSMDAVHLPSVTSQVGSERASERQRRAARECVR